MNKLDYRPSSVLAYTLKISLLLFAVVFVLPQASNAQSTSTQVFVDEVYTIVEEMPVFGNCDEAKDSKECSAKNMYDYISKNLEHPESDHDKEKAKGIVYLSFIVTSEGKVANVNLLRGMQDKEAYNNAAIKVIEEMPDWKPGKQRGVPVNVNFNIPVRFN